uniref:Uncharacterized protein n=1 Tax=Globisporangium ultimum (strain ATCC 200006 / CBS 805.95 / DAOM BR144) TaxID=431595 RepID=K3WJP1_GLOUD
MSSRICMFYARSTSADVHDWPVQFGKFYILGLHAPTRLSIRASVLLEPIVQEIQLFVGLAQWDMDVLILLKVLLYVIPANSVLRATTFAIRVLLDSIVPISIASQDLALLDHIRLEMLQFLRRSIEVLFLPIWIHLYQRRWADSVRAWANQ